MDENGAQPGHVASDADDQHFQDGLSVLDAVVGPQGREIVERIRKVSPDLGHHVVAYVFGEIYSSSALTVRQRQLATISGTSPRDSTSASPPPRSWRLSSTAPRTAGSRGR